VAQNAERLSQNCVEAGRRRVDLKLLLRRRLLGYLLLDGLLLANDRNGPDGD
jgi:hypothetical protein